MLFWIWQKTGQSGIFLDSDDRPILNDSGKMSAEQAKDYAETEFEKYRIFQDRVFQSDFDKLNTTRSNTK